MNKLYPFIINGVCENDGEDVCDIGYACDACPYSAKEEGITVGSMEEFEEAFRENKYEGAWLDSLLHIWHKYFYNYIEPIPLKIKSFFQRGFRGWADEDTWCFDYYLSGVISEGIKHLLKNGNTCFTKKDLKNIKQVIKTFETAKAITESNLRYIPSDKFTWKEYKKYVRFAEKAKKEHGSHYTILNKRETIKFEKGFELFKQYYFHLWD